MTDRELLEKAAKAAGIEKFAWCEPIYNISDMPKSGLIKRGGIWDYQNAVWNPLEDDGDAFRLMVSLGIEAYNDRYCGCARPTDKRRSYMFEPISGNGDCAEAATRRAIVRAAAAMGDAQ